MKRSFIRRQFIAVTIAIVAGTVLLCLFLNNVFLPRVYSGEKQEQLEDAYKVLNEACEDGILYKNKFDITFESIASNSNIEVEVITADGDILRSSSSSADNLKEQLLRSVFGVDDDDTVKITENENYVVQRSEDSRLGEEYLVLWGSLYDGNLIFMRTSIVAIEESTTISTRFFIVVGAISVAVAIIASALIATKMTAPILKMTELSKRMANLDFEAKYSSDKGRKNELDILGEHMNEMSEKLEGAIGDLKVANARLQEDIDRKNELEEMRSDFVSNVSHELKTPIALIEGYAEGLKEFGDEDAQTRDYYCDVIMDEAVKMNNMVKKLLNLNQLEFGGQAAEMRPFDLFEFVGNVVSSSALLATSKGARMEFDESGVCEVLGDEFMIEEVMTNYLSNAVNHVGGEMLIRVFFEDFGDRMRVNVFNTGDNIPEEDMENIWVKFYKVDKARTREYGGNGIGLSIVKAIMASHGCDGVVFWFELKKILLQK